MLYLIKKDFTAAQIYILAVSVLIPILISLSIWTMVDRFGGIFIGFFTIFSSAICVASSFLFVLNELNSAAETTFASLPLSRKTLVYSKFASSIIFITYCFMLIVLTSNIVIFSSRIEDPIFSRIFSPFALLGMLSFLIIVNSFVYPFVFKFGLGKGILYSFITLILLVSIFPLSDFILTALQGELNFNSELLYEQIANIILWFKGQSIYTILMLTVAFTIIFVQGSLLLSVKFYNKRDL